MKKILSIILLSACPFLTKAQYTSAPPIIAYDNCEQDPRWQWGGDRTRQWSYWTGSDHILPGSSSTASMTRSNVVARKGNYSYKARITKDLSYSGSKNTHRSELTFSTPGQTPIGWRWAAVSIYFPTDFCFDNSPMLVAFDVKANPDNYKTPFGLTVHNGRYVAGRANIGTSGPTGGETYTDLGPVEKGVWVDWVLHRNFEMNSNGYLELYKNGKLVYSYYGPNFVTSSGYAKEGYVHIGLYKWPWLSSNGEGWGPTQCNNPIEVYYDEYRFGYENAKLEDFLIDAQPAPAPAPVAPKISTAIPDETVEANTASTVIDLSKTFSDDKGISNLTLSVSGNSNTTLVKSAVISGTSLTLNFNAGQSGNSTVKIKATDSDGLSVEDAFIVTVKEAVNEAPKVAQPVADQSIAYNTTSKTISLSGVFSDDDGVSNLTYSVSGNSNPVLVKTATISGSSVVLGLAAKTTGTAVIKIRATDKGGLSVEDAFNVDIQPETNIELPGAPEPVMQINTGGSNVTLGGLLWSADKNFSGGSTYSNSSAIAGTTNDALYQSERYGNMNYAIPLTNGSYTVKLHFAEIYHTATNKRKFNVNVENSQGVLSNYDIVAKAGAKTAVIESFENVQVADGVLNVTFTNVMDNAKISAIEILKEGVAANTAPTVATAIADVQLNANATSKAISIASVFADDKGTTNLTYSVAGISNTTLVSDAVISGTTLTVKLAGNQTGTAQIRLKATDEEGLFVEDVFNVMVVNQAPTANAGSPKAITLPTSSVVLSGSGTDVDGTIQSFSWSQVSGADVNITNASVAAPTISGFTQAGTYTFALVVTDNLNKTSVADQVTVTVNAAPSSSPVTGLTLVNASTDKDALNITDGSEINLASTGTALNIRANTQSGVSKVAFAMSGAQSRSVTESVAPFALFGDSNGNYYNWNPPLGSYTLTVTPYLSNGSAGTPLTVRFTVVNQSGANTRAAMTVVDGQMSTDKKHVSEPVLQALNAYPNPFTDVVNIEYKVSKDSRVKMSIISQDGKIVKVYPEENVIANTLFRKQFSGNNLPNGVYFYRISTDAGEVKMGRIVLAK